METPSFSHNGRQGYQVERRESHWQPALRPETQDFRDEVSIENAAGPFRASVSLPYDQATEVEKADSEKSLQDANNQELPSDDDDERLDPAWGIRPTASVRILDGARRSSSFPRFEPEVPATTLVPLYVAPPVVTAPSSQLEDLLNGNTEEAEDNPDVSTVTGEDMLMGQAEQMQHPIGLDELQSGGVSDRYQEGLPLIDSRHQPTELDWATLTDSLASDRFDVGAVTDEAAFFTQPQSAPDGLEVPSVLDRKSTLDVFDSMHIQHAGPSDPLVAFHTEDEPVSFGSVPPVDKASSKSMNGNTLTLDAFAQEPSADDLFSSAVSHEQNTFELLPDEPLVEDVFPVQNKAEAQFDVFAQEPSADDIFLSELPSAQTQPVDTDAKWAAVLDDDEFLVEDADDLLPDSEPGSPSSFIASLQDDSAILDSSLNAPYNPLNSQPDRSTADKQALNPPTPHQLSTSEMAQLSPKAHGNVGFSRPGLAPMGSFQSQLQRPTLATHAESFADQAKGGYKSPYDLPMSLAKPKKRPLTQKAISVPQRGMPLPPPRTSSMSSDRPLGSPFTPTGQTFPSATANSMVTSPPGVRTSSSGALPAPKRNVSSSGFFEELPMTSRPRPTAPAPAPGSGRYTPSQNVSVLPPQLPPQGPTPQAPPALSRPSPPRPSDISVAAQYQLQPPERLDPYANIALQPQSTVPVATVSRYSPAPSAALGAPRPTPSPRYSPAPPSQPPSGSNRYVSQPLSAQPSAPTPPASNRYVSQPISAPPAANSALQFQPRTSSPLAYQRSGPGEETHDSMPPPSLPRAAGVLSSGALLSSPPRQVAPTKPSGLNNPPAFSPPARPDQIQQITFQPPKRSQTQSPSRQLGSRPAFPIPPENVLDRPASSYSHSTSATVNAKSIPSFTTQITLPRAAPASLEFILPNDNTRDDPLERWKGAPVFRFGFGGNVVSCFPKHTPRYSSSLTRPQIKPTAGEVMVRKAKDIAPLPEHISTFPGPLRGKSKKKDVLAWLTASIARLEAESPPFLGLAHTLPDPQICHDEKVLLWKIVKVLVEHDGVLDTNAEALKALNTILAPEVHATDESTASQRHDDPETTGIYRPLGISARPDAADPSAVEILRKHLMRGKRDDAVWHAVDSRLWSHALLISSTMDRSIWKQVVQEFVRQEVRTIGNNTESLAAIYEIFGGNVDDSVDQLVPPSARAGLQMVSKIDSTGPTRNALDGLNRWKETLVLVLNNRSIDDQKALIALSRLLSDYGRTEAAHICLLFARSPVFPTLLGGIDDPQSHITLLGADRRFNAVQNDQDAILLTEVYEFATSTLGGATIAAPMPYLASYKLQRAKQLSDHGMKIEAQAYCEAIAASVGTKTKISPYYHPVLLGELEDLSNRLKQVPVQSTSWITKPSIERVSGSIFSKFTNFVAGDDSDAESKGSGKDVSTEAGPFANVSGSPTLSRSGSQTDIYGSFPTMTSVMPAVSAGSRYAPNGMASTRSSSEFGRGRPSVDSQRSPPSSSYGHEPRTSLYAPMTQNQPPAKGTSAYQPLDTSPGKSVGVSPSRDHHQAPITQNSYMPVSVRQHASNGVSEQTNNSYLPTPQQDEQISYVSTQSAEIDQPAYGGYVPSSQPAVGFEPSQFEPDSQPTATYDVTQSYGYEPPADTGYTPYQPEPDSDDDDNSKKRKTNKKSFMDDENEFTYVPTKPQSSPPGSSSDDSAARRKLADEATNAAFLAAAAEDERRAKEQAAAKKSGSWFGGWLGGKKGDKDSLDSSSGSGGGGGDSKVHRAKLGETKMKLYYDEKLKKWVNPDDPDSGKAKAGPPPPPRTGGTPAPVPGGGMLPPRSTAVSASPVPMPMTTSRSSTPASHMGDASVSALPPTSSAGLGLVNGAAAVPLPRSGAGTPALGGGPPRLPASSSTNSIDDLLGPPIGGARGKGAKGGKKKAGRYVDVMAQS